MSHVFTHAQEGNFSCPVATQLAWLNQQQQHKIQPHILAEFSVYHCAPAFLMVHKNLQRDLRITKM